MLRRALGILVAAILTTAGRPAVVVNPVPAPIAPGMGVSISLFGQAPATSDPQQTGFSARIQSLQSPRDGSNRLFVNDTAGTINVTNTVGTTPSVWFDIRTAVANFSNAANATQTGLMGFAFHPNFNGDPSKPGYGVFYTIDTSAPNGKEPLRGDGPSVNHDDVIHEFTVADPAAATATIVSQREVMRIAQPLSDHGAGTIAFNPNATLGSADYGKLYVGMGDGGGAGDPYGNAQDLSSPFGKILRIDPATGPGGPGYTIPADNPYAGQAGKLGEVYASGLRNPQAFSWDNSGHLLVADIGQEQLDEVDIVTPGKNYGWPLREGTFARGASDDPNVYDTPTNDGSFIDPVAQFDHEEIERSGKYNLAAISGVFTYEGAAIPQLDGMTIVSELVSGRLFYYDPASAAMGGQATLQELMLSYNGADTTMSALEGNAYLGGRVDLRMGADADGEIYLLSKANGDIYRLGALASVPEPANWAMLMLGFGLIGAAARQRRSRAFPTVTCPCAAIEPSLAAHHGPHPPHAYGFS